MAAARDLADMIVVAVATETPQHSVRKGTDVMMLNPPAIDIRNWPRLGSNAIGDSLSGRLLFTRPDLSESKVLWSLWKADMGWLVLGKINTATTVTTIIYMASTRYGA